MVELTKSGKKVVRRLIDKALNQDYINGIKKIKKLIRKWEDEPSEPQKSYLDLFKTRRSHDETLKRKFDGLTGEGFYSCRKAMFC